MDFQKTHFFFQECGDFIDFFSKNVVCNNVVIIHHIFGNYQKKSPHFWKETKVTKYLDFSLPIPRIVQ